MLLVRDGDELDVQLEGRLVRIDRGLISPTPPRIIACDDVDDAIAAHDAEVAALRADGYVEAPDPVLDDDARLVYADALQLRGEPFGELITVSYELAHTRDDKQRVRAAHRFETLLQDHHERWFGRLARHVRSPLGKSPTAPSVQVRWRLGLAEDVTFADGANRHIYELWRALPLSRHARRLVLDTNMAELFGAMVEHGVPSRLRELVVGGASVAGTLTRYGDLAAVVDAARSLEALRVLAGHGSLAIASPTLRVLELHDVTHDDLEALASARLPALESLTLRTRWPTAMRRIFELFPRLVHLTLDGFARGDAERSLLDSLGSFPSTLRSLALPRCRLDDRDLVIVLREPGRFRTLARLDARHNRFSRHLAATAKRALPALRTR